MSHFADMSWFALIVSVALAVLSRRSTIDRVKYAVMSFVAFLLVSIAIGWLMFPFSR
jgi:heme A synthase